MTHSYTVTGMTCDGCQAKVQFLLSKVEGVSNVNVDWRKNEATITMKNHIHTSTLKEALSAYPKYQLSEKQHAPTPVFADEEQRTWFETYKPVLLIFAYITGITLLVQTLHSEFHWMQWMNHFMAGFFITFSFFKFLNLSGFADSYSSYDIIAKHWRGYGYLYAFIELGLGLACLVNFNPLITNTAILIVMGVSIIGVLQSLLANRKIKCACLGEVFNLPMSTITVIEDGLMILMSIIMLMNLI